MKASEMVDTLLKLIDQYGDVDVSAQDINNIPEEEDEIIDCIQLVDSIDYVELPLDEGYYPCILINID